MDASRPASAPPQSFGRRRFFELAGTAGAAAVLSTGLNLGLTGVPPLFTAGGDVEALVLSCMDFRLVNEVGFLLNEHGLVNKYDQIVLAGATLGVATDKYPAWADTYWDHLSLAIELHGVKRVIADNHRDRGAFKLAFGKDFGTLPDEETEIHTRVMTDFRDQMKTKQPNIEVELLLMWLDGHVQPIGNGAATSAASGRH